LLQETNIKMDKWAEEKEINFKLLQEIHNVCNKDHADNPLRVNPTIQMIQRILEGSGTLSEQHPVAEEGDLGRAEVALRRVDQDPVPLETVEKSPEVLVMSSEALGEIKDAVQGSATLSEQHPVAEEGDLGRAEVALRRVDQDPW
jgi:hypothetical protein